MSIVYRVNANSNPDDDNKPVRQIFSQHVIFSYCKKKRKNGGFGKLELMFMKHYAPNRWGGGGGGGGGGGVKWGGGQVGGGGGGGLGGSGWM